MALPKNGLCKHGAGKAAAERSQGSHSVDGRGKAMAWEPHLTGPIKSNKIKLEIQIDISHWDSSIARDLVWLGSESLAVVSVLNFNFCCYSLKGLEHHKYICRESYKRAKIILNVIIDVNVFEM